MSTLFRLSTFFLLALSFFLSTVSARHHFNTVAKRSGSDLYVTNAARMAAGLGPMMPRNLFNPTHVKVARQQPSAITPTLSGRVEITLADTGAFVGYVNKDSYTSGRLHVNTNPNTPNDDLTVSFAQPASTSSLFNILITSNGNPTYPNLGFAYNLINLGTGNLEYTTMTSTNPTTPGGVASPGENGMSAINPYSESPIWSYDASNGRLSSTWFNPISPGSSIGTPVTVKHYYHASTGYLFQSRIDLTPVDYLEVVLTLNTYFPLSTN